MSLPENAAAADAEYDVAVVGAGIAGLTAATTLAATGRRVVVLEKSRGVGGRMATRRVGEAVCDHGAQQFSVTGRAFGNLVTAAETAGVVDSWCQLFPTAATAAGPVTAPLDEAGHARWRGTRGMTSLPKYLVAALPTPVRTQTRVEAISIDAGRVRLTDEQGQHVVAAAAIVTAPVPQALDLFTAGGLTPPLVDEATWETLAAIRYEPCFSLMLVLKRPSLLPAPGGLAVNSGPVAWLTDNQQKGISSVPSLTIQARGDFSRDHFDDDPEEVTGQLIDLARPWIDGDPAAVVVASSLQRWKFAFPENPLKAPLVALSQQPPIVCCGDSFGGGLVEAAASSGLAVARWLERLPG